MFGSARSLSSARLTNRARTRLTVQTLEDRSVPAQFLVTSKLGDNSPGTLGDMINQANSLPGADEIIFDTAGAFSGASTPVALTANLPTITDDLTITGYGNAKLAVSGGGARRVLDSTASRLILSGFTVTGGLADNSAGLPNGEFGGGLRASGFVTLDHMVFTGNKATGPNSYDFDVGAGGGIGMNPGAFLLVRNSTIANNTADQKGGGIFVRDGGGLQLENSTVSGNTITPPAAGTFFEGWGGAGIFFAGSPVNSNYPGEFRPRTVLIQSSTVAENFSPGSGGGFEGWSMNGILLVQASTISGNTAAGDYYGGGGIAAVYSYFQTWVQDGVVSGNISPAAPDIRGNEVHALYGAIGSATGINTGTFYFDSASMALLGQPLLLDELHDNGGPTLTVRPKAGSPLIDGGKYGLQGGSFNTDQRGFDRIFNNTIDIGAYEVQTPKVTVEQSSTQADPTLQAPISFNVAFAVPVTGFAANDLSFAGSTVPGSLAGLITQTGPTTYSVAVTGMTGDGEVCMSVVAGAALDENGLASRASISEDNSVIFGVAPKVTIARGAMQPSLTSLMPIVFDVVFDEGVDDTNFDASDIDFSSSTAGDIGSFIVTVDKVTQSTYTVTVDGVTTRGDVIATIPAGRVSDFWGNLNEASTGTNNVVAFRQTGMINLTTSTQTTSEGATVTVTASRTGGSEGIVSVDYGSAENSAHVSDYEAAPGFSLSGTFTWGEGDSADKSFDIKIVDDNANEGREAFTVGLSNAQGAVFLGATTTEDIVITPSDGHVIDGAAVKPAKPQFVFTDADGDLVTVKLAGGLGTATIFLSDPDGDGNGPIELLQLAGTDSVQSKLTIAAKKGPGKKGNGRAELYELTGTELNSLTAPTTDLITTGITFSGYVAALTIGNFIGGPDIVLNGTPPATLKNPGVKIKTAYINDGGTDIAVPNGPIDSLTAWSIGSGATISAPYAEAINITGHKGSGGNLGSNITLSGVGVPANTPALKSLKVHGQAYGATIKVGSGTGTVGDIGSVSFGGFYSSRLYAGYSGPDDGSGTFNLPNATIGKFTTRYRSFSFYGSIVIAANFKSSSTLTSGGGGRFIYHGTFGGVTVANKKKSYDKKLGGSQVVADGIEVVQV